MTDEIITLSEVEVERVLRELAHLDLQDLREGRNRWKALCPFHEDHDPSLHITTDGLYYCFACKASGNLTTLIHQIQKTQHPKHAWHKILKYLGKERKEKKATRQQVQQWHTALLKNEERLLWLQENRGLSIETIVSRSLGWAQERDQGKGAYVLPFFEENRVALVRFYLPHLKKGKQRGQKGHNATFPCWSACKEGPLLIVESELDWMLVEQLGFRGFTATNGAGNIARWIVEHADSFRDQVIVLCFDKDEAGFKATQSVALGLWGIASKIAWLQWPDEVQSGTDPTDFLIRDGHPERDFRALVETAEPITESIINRWKEDVAQNAANQHVAGEHALRDLIEELHWFENSKGILRRYDSVQPPWKLGLAVIEWFKQQDARFFHDRQGRGYLLFRRELREIGKSAEFCSLLWSLGGCNRETAEGRYIIESLLCYALRQGEAISNFNWLHLSRRSWALYVNLHNDRDEILRIAPGQISVFPNGTNPDHIVLNRSSAMEPIEFDAETDIKEAMTAWKELVFDAFAVDPVARTLIAGWSWVMWLRTLSQEKPILKLSGRMESGKSAIGRLLSMLIYGEDRASVSTTAANFSQAATEPLIFLDDLETRQLGPAMSQFLKVVATGITRTKRTIGTVSDVSLERGDALVLITAIESLPMREVQSRTYEIETRDEYKMPLFNFKGRLDELMICRSRILSGFFRLLAEEILPLLQRGADEQYLSYFTKDVHAKFRTNNFLALMLLMVNAISRFVPLWPPVVAHSELKAPKAGQLAGAWILHQDQLDAETGAESSICLGYLNALLGQLSHSGILYHSAHMDSDDRDLLIRKAQSFGINELVFHENGDGRPHVVGFRASTAELFWALAKVGKEMGRGFPISNPRALGQRVANDMPLLESDAWAMSGNGIVKGTSKYLWIKGGYEPEAVKICSVKKLQEEFPWE